MRLPDSNRLHLTRQPTSARQARRFVRDALHRIGAGPVADVGVLLTSELVTNAVLYGAGDVEIAVVADHARRVRVTVRDGNDAEPVPQHPAADDTSGRGLRLVEILADRWGVDHDAAGPGKAVWFELAY